MKIAIITLIGEFNNGNRLQNYALQQSLLKVCPDAIVETIYFNPYNSLYKKLKYLLKKVLRKAPYIKNFREFNKNIQFSSKKYNEEKFDYLELLNEYDFFIVGSDQVWNLGYLKNEQLFFLNWVPSTQKLSYAASIGNNIIFQKEEAMFKVLLKDFNKISVREKQSEELLNSLGFNNVTTNIDPTFLIEKSEWEKLIKPTRYKFKKREYIFICILGNISNEYIEIINKIAKKYDLEIINLYDRKKQKIFKSGPSEFLYFIKHAKLVITDSFHSIVFSIIFKIPFIHFERQDVGANAKINSRIENLERIFGTKFNTLSNIDTNSDSIFNFSLQNTYNIIEQERIKSLEYLRASLTHNTKITLEDVKFNCSGCGLCANICPQKAIKIIKNKQGFYQYNLDKNKCNKCGACLKLCPSNKSFDKTNWQETTILGAKNHSPVDDNSSSAGIFAKLATSVIANNGIVYGLSYNTNNEFERINKIDDLEKIKGSKYYQANISTIYQKIEKDLKKDRTVLVCGTPCQIAGLKQKFSNIENLITIGVVCHGTPSKDVLDEYCLERFDNLPNFINFRKKNPNWTDYYIQFNFNDKIITEKATDNLWFNGFLSNIFLNESCYNCNFAGKNFGADIILGDFWGINNIDKKFYDKSGTSIVIINTEVGKKLINSIRNQVVMKEYHNIKQILHFNPCIAKTNYHILKKYSKNLFFINRDQKIPFSENVKYVQKTFPQPKRGFVKKAVKKITRILFKK